MKKFLTSALFGAVASVCSFTSFAADIEGGVVQHDMKSSVTAFMSEEAREFMDVPPMLQRFEPIENSALREHAPLAPAQGISYFEVGMVYSSNQGLKRVNAGDFITADDHGGAQLFVYVWQFGYGNPNNATMNGFSKSTGLSDPRCGNDLHVCSAGETVTGWLYGWDFSGQQSGYFTASANSTAFPFGYWSDSISIK